MYTPIIAAADLNSVMYPEVQATISRNDGGALANEAIAAAIDEAQMYLTRYDLAQLFGSPSQNSSATYAAPMLVRLLKNMALWHFIKLANVNILYESARESYEDAIKTLKDIQKGIADPNWPLASAAEATLAAPSAGGGSIINNPLRNTSGYATQTQSPNP